MIKNRKLGSQGLEVSEIGLGCMGLSMSFPPFPTREEAISFLKQAYVEGERFFDTAEVYGPFDNEEIIGIALKNVRENVVISTKFGFKFENGKNVGVDSSRENIRNSIEGSLKRLQTNYIDLYFQHRVDPNVPIEEVALVMKELINEGKVKYWGLSEASASTIRKAHAICPVSVVQSEYSMFWREPEEKIFPVLEELGIGFIAFSPLGRGFLTGAVKPGMIFPEGDFRNTIPRFNNQEYFVANMSLVNFVQELANKKETTPGAIALAWILHQKSWIVPIPGTKKINRLIENISSTNINFSEQEIKEIKKNLDSIEILGNRYSDANQKLIDKD